MEQTMNGENAELLKKLPSLLLPWYDKNKRDLPWRENTDPYRVWKSEIMLQQTRVEAAKEHYIRFLRELPDAEALARCPEDKLFKLWEGLGYYSRARNLQKTAKIVAEQGFPQTAENLKKLPGVGEYTAGAIASIAFGQPSPAVDGNVIRVLSRLLADGRPAETLKTEFFKLLAPAYPAERCGDFTQSLMELGATVCLPSSPLCLACPLLSLCKTKSDALPARREKPQRRRQDITLLLFRTGEKIAVCRRKAGVLRGMYGFFTIAAPLTAPQADAFLRCTGMKNFAVRAGGSHKHIFSHIEWDMTAYIVDLQKNPVPPGSAEQGETAQNRAETEIACAAETELTGAAKSESAAQAPLIPVGTEISDFADLQYFTKEEIDEKISLPSAFRWCLKIL